MSKKAIITGAAGGLGTAVTKAFLAQDYDVTTLLQPGHPDQVKRIQDISEKAHTHPLDVLDEQSVKDFANQADTPVDALVLLVGGFDMGGLEDTPASAVEQMVQLNFFSAYHLVRAFWQRLEKAQAGKIILIGAKPALHPEAGHGLLAYSLSKGMIFHLAELLNQTGKETHTQAVVVVPSIIDTQANREAMPEANFNDWVRPEQIAEVITTACQDSPLRQQVYHVYGNS